MFITQLFSCCFDIDMHSAGDDDTVTFSFGALVDKIKENLSPQAISGKANGSRSRGERGAGLSAQPRAAQLPRSSLSSAGKGSSIQRMLSRMQALPKGESAQHQAFVGWHSVDRSQ